MAGTSIERGIRSRRVVTARGVAPACLLVGGGAIREVAGFDEAPAGLPLDDWGDLALLPGLVDTHVHVNEPGRTAWEGFASATRAAAAGGVTTIVDMPLNAIPATTRRAALEAKRAAAAAAPLEADVAFWGGVVPGNIGELEPLASAGVAGFKAFLSPSGVEEFPAIEIGDLALAAAEVRRLEMALGRPLPILVHAEAPAVLAAAARGAAGTAGRAARRSSYAAWLESRPVAAETGAIEGLVGIARSTGAALHVVHVSSGAGAALLADARREGLRLSGETCPHYLTFSAEAIADGATPWKCAPPIRDAGEREALWKALAAGSLALVASDHSPCPPDLKRPEEGDFFAAWGGIASLELSLAATWTGAVARGAALPDIAEWMAAAPARLAGLGGRKGRLAAGGDADCVVFDPEAALRVDPGALHQRHPITPYAGRTLVGRVRATYRRGVVAFRDGDFPGAPPGRILAIPAGGSGSGGHGSAGSA